MNQKNIKNFCPELTKYELVITRLNNDIHKDMYNKFIEVYLEIDRLYDEHLKEYEKQMQDSDLPPSVKLEMLNKILEQFEYNYSNTIQLCNFLFYNLTDDGILERLHQDR